MMVLSHKVFTRDGRPNPVHTFDAGAAFENLALQGAAMGLVVHGMAGFDRGKARTTLAVPEDYDVEAMVAVGHPGDPAELPPQLRAREVPTGRNAVREFIREARSRLGSRSPIRGQGVPGEDDRAAGRIGDGRHHGLIAQSGQAVDHCLAHGRCGQEEAAGHSQGKSTGRPTERASHCGDDLGERGAGGGEQPCPVVGGLGAGRQDLGSQGGDPGA
jgi:hypothetical protein